MSEASKQKTVALHTLGCRLNIAETASLAQGFVERGYRVVEFGSVADITVLNTCTVTSRADASCRNAIRRALKFSPKGKLVVIGCYAQLESEALKKIAGVDLILGTGQKGQLFDLLERQENVFIEQTGKFSFARSSLAGTHTRAFLKIQDGCNYFCSYCIIPYARGPARAPLIEELCQQAELLIQDGFKEIVLTGVNIGEFEDQKKRRLPQLLESMLSLPGLKRLRLSSIEPNTISEPLLKIVSQSDKFMDHLHVPLQNGDDEILRLMNRKYSVHDYQVLLERIKKYLPNCSIGTDCIVGFPGEQARHFENTFQLLNNLPLTHFHIFPYSSRQGTKAAAMSDSVRDPDKKERAHRLIRLGEQKMAEFARNMVGQQNQVLFERLDRDGYYDGLTTNYVRVKLKCERDLTNQIVPVTLMSFSNEHFEGTL